MMHRIKITFEIVDDQARMLIDGVLSGAMPSATRA